jgi:hypothetical protein
MRWLVLAALALAWPVMAAPSRAVAEEDVVHVTSRVTYDARPDEGPVRVSWEVNFQNNDPNTSVRGATGEVLFYQNVTVPMLRGASAISAVSSSGNSLDVELRDEGPGPTVAATISFDERIFFGETFDFSLGYELKDVRVPSLLVTPAYVYLPLIAGGDEASVTVNHPSGGGWNVSLDAAECGQEGASFVCSGNDSGFLAALLEISRPDAVASIPFEITLQEKTVSVQLSYFLGEERAANHLRQLATAALPIIEEQYGFAYPGKEAVTISQGGRQAVLGYEGLTSCEPNGECSVVVSPAADDVTFIHELAHLWSHIYEKRWLSEAFAQVIAEETAAALPETLVESEPPARDTAAINLPLDEWGSVTSLIGAAPAEREIENAGYQRSAQFLHELRSAVGSDALKRANATIAGSGRPANSERFLDTLEEVSGKRLDGLFAEWVFPESYAPTLDLRRQARDRLGALYQAAAEKGLSEDLPDGIRSQVAEWQFSEALAALDEAERNLGEYDVLKRAIDLLGEGARAAGLELPSSVGEDLQRWDFTAVRVRVAEAARAVDAYTEARERVRSSGNLWERIGLIGKSPEAQLQLAAKEFASGDFAESAEHASDAREMVSGASSTALRRVLLVGGLLGMVALGIWAGVWFAGRREREYAEL